MQNVVFASIKASVDGSFKDYEEKSAKNKKNIGKRWANRDIPSDTTRTTGNHSIPNDTEEDASKEADSSIGEHSSAVPALGGGEQQCMD